MSIRIAINGFGRIGRLSLRAIFEHRDTEFEIVGINDLADNETLAHMLKYDSVHGRFPFPVTHAADSITVNGQSIPAFAIRDPKDLPWRDLDVDIVFECTGLFRTKELAGGHIRAGAKRVLISAPAKDDSKMIVYGVNQDILTGDDVIISNASCTTNGLAPIAKLLHEHFTIEGGVLTTVHAYTMSQPILDKAGKDLYRGRAAALSMVPTTTGAAKAIGRVLPELDGKLSGVALRVPVPDVSVIDLNVNVKTPTDAESLNALFRQASQHAYKGILGYAEDKMVSVDLVHDDHSSIIVPDQTIVQNAGRLLRIFAWYDNEWGFANRMCDTAKHFAHVSGISKG